MPLITITAKGSALLRTEEIRMVRELTSFEKPALKIVFIDGTEQIIHFVDNVKESIDKIMAATNDCDQ